METGNHSIEVSVVIPTLNRHDLLRDVLESLFVQTYDPKKFEIIVVDDASVDQTPEVVKELQKVAPCDLRYHRLEKRMGPAHARNLAVNMARGATIAFTDSDCRTHPDWLKKGMSGFRDDVAFITGSILHKPGQRVRLFSGMFPPVQHEHPTYPTCNVFYRKKIFLDMGGFDEKLFFFTVFDDKPIEAADTDLAWRIKEAGWKNLFQADQIVYHEVPVRGMWRWMAEPYRIFVLPFLVRQHPPLRKLMLHAGLFFQTENLLLYMIFIGLFLGALVHPLFLLLTLLYPLRIAWMLRENLTLLKFPKLMLQIPLLAARQVVLCAGLIYGSIRFGSLVL